MELLQYAQGINDGINNKFHETKGEGDVYSSVKAEDFVKSMAEKGKAHPSNEGINNKFHEINPVLDEKEDIKEVNIMNKTGQFGLEETSKVVVTILGIGLMMVVVMITLGIIHDSNMTTQILTGQIDNETMTFTNVSVGNSTATLLGLETGIITLSSVIITNATGGEIILANNYTVTNEYVDADKDSLYLNVLVNVSASYSDATKLSRDIIRNTSQGLDNFTDEIPTIFIILGLIIIIILFAVLIRSGRNVST